VAVASCGLCRTGEEVVPCTAAVGGCHIRAASLGRGSGVVAARTRRRRHRVWPPLTK